MVPKYKQTDRIKLTSFNLQALAAPLVFSNVFGDHMVLQRGQPIRVWGWTSPNAAITGLFSSSQGDVTQSGTADATGFWKLTWAALPASMKPATIAVTQSATGQTITLRDVLIGDVFLCSGQSNMEFTTNDVVNASQELSAANNYPNIRITSGPLQGKLKLDTIPASPQDTLVAADLPWSVANASTVGGVGGGGGWDFFSAACWLTLKYTYDANAVAGHAVPLGGVVQCYGGTSIQYWSSPEAIASCPASASNPGTACCNYGGKNSCLYNAQIHPYTLGPTQV